ncbi:DUF397 domain-containing protein [Streptomyces sp. NRRL F-5630]|uniref:DUF397 domain-containing protein n=1 Tax=Streptomyces sp. NRRL F-5630 TaxID=1463864 RepID=UPI003EB92DA9
MTTPAPLAGAVWRTSSYSGPNNECVAIALTHGVVGVRDSKEAQGPTLVLSGASWTAALDAVRDNTL